MATIIVTITTIIVTITSSDQTVSLTTTLPTHHDTCRR